MLLNAAAGDAGYIVCSKDATYDLHIRRSGVVAYSKAKGTSWVPLATGKQQPLTDLVTDLSLLEFTTRMARCGCSARSRTLRRAAHVCRRTPPQRTSAPAFAHCTSSALSVGSHHGHFPSPAQRRKSNKHTYHYE